MKKLILFLAISLYIFAANAFTVSNNSLGGQTEVANVDQQFFRRYLALTESQRRMVRDVDGEFKTISWSLTDLTFDFHRPVHGR